MNLTITRIRSVSGSYSSTNTLVISLPALPATSNVYVAVISTYDSSGQGAPIATIYQDGVGWAPQKQKTNGYNNIEIWLGIVNASAVPSTANQLTIQASKVPSGGLRADIFQYSGVGLQQDINNDGTSTGTGTTTGTGSATTTAGSELVIGGVFISGHGQTGPALNGFQFYDGTQDSSGNSLAVVDNIVSTNDTYSSGTNVSGGSGTWYGCIVSFKPIGTTTSSADTYTVNDALTLKAYQNNSIDLYTSGTTMGGPILNVDSALLTANDIMVFGSITTMTDPNKAAGGGAFIIGHGWTGSGSPLALAPSILELGDSTLQIQSGSSFPTGMNNQAGAVFNRTDQGVLYIWTGSTWNAVGSTSGYYDTLFLIQNNGYTPANLNLGNLYAQNSVIFSIGYPVLSQGNYGSLRIATSYGSVDIGPMNSTFMHFQQNSGSAKPYYFDNDIYLNGALRNYNYNFTLDGLGNLTTAGVIQANGGYKSSDGSTGYTGSITFGTGHTATVKNGLITAYS